MDLSAGPLAMFLTSFFGQGLGFLAVVALVYQVVWVWGRQRLAAARIPTRRQADRAQIRREIKHTLVTLGIGAGYGTLVGLLYQAGLTRLSTDPSGWSWPMLAATVVGLVVFNDAWFYGLHRLLHHPALFRHVHAVHHQSVDVNPFSSYSFHAVEGLLLSAWIVPVVMAVPIYAPIFGVVHVIGTANNLMSHLGYELLPRWLLRVPGLRWMNTATFHSQHHTQFNGNYGLFFRFWDRLLGTELPGYEQAFLQRGAVGKGPQEGMAPAGPVAAP